MLQAFLLLSVTWGPCEAAPGATTILVRPVRGQHGRILVRAHLLACRRPPSCCILQSSGHSSFLYRDPGPILGAQSPKTDPTEGLEQTLGPQEGISSAIPGLLALLRGSLETQPSRHS